MFWENTKECFENLFNTIKDCTTRFCYQDAPNSVCVPHIARLKVFLFLTVLRKGNKCSLSRVANVPGFSYSVVLQFGPCWTPFDLLFTCIECLFDPGLTRCSAFWFIRAEGSRILFTDTKFNNIRGIFCFKLWITSNVRLCSDMIGVCIWTRRSLNRRYGTTRYVITVKFTDPLWTSWTIYSTDHTRIAI